MIMEVKEIREEEEYIIPFEQSYIYISTVARLHEYMVHGCTQLRKYNTPSYFLLDVAYEEKVKRIKTHIYQIPFKNKEETLYSVMTGPNKWLKCFRMSNPDILLVGHDSPDGYTSILQLTRAAIMASRNILLPKRAKVVLYTEALGDDFDRISKLSGIEVSNETQTWFKKLINGAWGTRRLCFIGIDKESNERRI